MKSIRFKHSRFGSLDWNHAYSGTPALAAIFALRETARFDPDTRQFEFATNKEGITEAASSAYDLAGVVSDWMGTIAMLGVSHLDQFDDFDEDNRPSKSDAELARKAFVCLEGLRELHTTLHEFMGIAYGAKAEFDFDKERKVGLTDHGEAHDH
jgi:hypothetical protein